MGDVLVVLRGGHVHDGLVLDLGHDLVPEVGLGDLSDVVRVGKDAVGGVQKGLQPVLVAECLFEIHCSHLTIWFCSLILLYAPIGCLSLNL